MKPIITVYSTGTKEPSKKFEGYIAAAFWIGVDHVEGEVGSVKVRQPVESYDDEVVSLTEFVDLLVERQINYSVEFFAEPIPLDQSPEPPPQTKQRAQGAAPAMDEALDFEVELGKIRADYQNGTLTKAQYESKKGTLLRKWKERIEAKLGL